MLTVDYDRFDVRPGLRVLDLGCGFGRHTYEALVRGADVVSADLAAEEVAAVASQGDEMAADGWFDTRLLREALRADAISLPFNDETFDRVIASEVLEHIDDDVAALAELFRVTKPGATIAVTVPATLSERVCWRLSDEYHAPFVEGGHVRIYTESELRAKLRAAGFAPRMSYKAHALHTPYWWLRCLVGLSVPPADHWLLSRYQRFLEWDLMTKPALPARLERFLNPLLGKSLIVHAERPA